MLGVSVEKNGVDSIVSFNEFVNTKKKKSFITVYSIVNILLMFSSDCFSRKHFN